MCLIIFFLLCPIKAAVLVFYTHPKTCKHKANRCPVVKLQYHFIALFIGKRRHPFLIYCKIPKNQHFEKIFKIIGKLYFLVLYIFLVIEFPTVGFIEIIYFPLHVLKKLILKRCELTIPF